MQLGPGTEAPDRADSAEGPWPGPPRSPGWTTCRYQHSAVRSWKARRMTLNQCVPCRAVRWDRWGCVMRAALAACKGALMVNTSTSPWLQCCSLSSLDLLFPQWTEFYRAFGTDRGKTLQSSWMVLYPRCLSHRLHETDGNGAQNKQLLLALLAA